jgi:hypothetical protein
MMMGKMPQMDEDEMYGKTKEDELKALIQRMYGLMMDDYEGADEPMPEGMEMSEVDYDAEDEEPSLEAIMGEEPEEDEFKSEVKDFMTGKKPDEKEEGVAVAISTKLAGMPSKKKKKYK